MHSTRLLSELTDKGKKVGKFVLDRKLGEGKFGKVFIARNVETEEIFAAKQVDQKKVLTHLIHARLLQTEINVMNEINHPNIIHLHDLLKTENNFYLIVDYCNQGDYPTFMKNKGINRLEETEAVCYLQQIANGFQELRKRKILHRDFKLDNLFFHNNRLIIGDFGFSKSGAEVATTILGTPLTMAYELLTAGKSGIVYSSKADIWSIGVVYYEMLFGKPPFGGDTIDELIKNIKETAGDNLKFPLKVSNESQNILKQMLQTDPNNRMSWFEFFNHELFDKFKIKDDTTFHNIFLLDDSKKFRAGDSNQEFNNNKKLIKKSEEVKYSLDSSDIKVKHNIELDKVSVMDEMLIDSKTKTDLEERLFTKDINNKYRHEINKIIYFFWTVRNIQEHLKAKYYAPVANELLEGSVYIIYKGLKYIDKHITDLKNGYNEFLFNSNYYNKFVKSKRSDWILKELCEFQDKFTYYLKKLKARMVKKKIKFDFKLMEKKHLVEIQEDLEMTYNYVKGYLGSGELKNKEKYAHFLRILFSLKFSLNHETMLNFVDIEDGVPYKFNWEQFNMLQDKMDTEMLKSLI